VIASQAVLIAVAVDREGRRQILAVELANRESRSSWREFLLGLRQRGLFGVEFVVSDYHAMLGKMRTTCVRRQPVILESQNATSVADGATYLKTETDRRNYFDAARVASMSSRVDWR
jgi:Transposase, Mutator family